MNESTKMVKPLIRGAIIAILTMNLVEKFEISTLGYSTVVYALAMKGFNVVARQVQDV